MRNGELWLLLSCKVYVLVEGLPTRVSQRKEVSAVLKLS